MAWTFTGRCTLESHSDEPDCRIPSVATCLKDVGQMGLAACFRTVSAAAQPDLETVPYVPQMSLFCKLTTRLCSLCSLLFLRRRQVIPQAAELFMFIFPQLQSCYASVEGRILFVPEAEGWWRQRRASGWTKRRCRRSGGGRDSARASYRKLPELCYRCMPCSAYFRRSRMTTGEIYASK